VEDMNVSPPLFAQELSLLKAIRLILPKAVGVIAKLGSAVRGFKVGDRVGYMMFTDFCGKIR
jgi:threonine dehydrogenase-like Zn-dependent dehydrogenase